METQNNTDVSEAVFAGLSADIEGVTDSRAPLVLLHGLTYDRTIWAPVLDHLRRIDPDRRVLALDLPGHGGTPGRASNTSRETVDRIHDAVRAAGLDAPVLVGHSMSGGMASFYASTHPCRGVINVDAPLNVAPFAAMLQQNAEALRGPAFPKIWESLTAGFHIELLPADVQKIVYASSRPDQAMQLSYWQDFLESSPAEIEQLVTRSAAAIQARAIPYVLLLGSPIDPGSEALIARVVPDATVLTWPGTGHFPHLARVAEFAQLLADTGGWQPGARAA